MPRKIDEQVIVITGASSGIGLATARAAASRGAKSVRLMGSRLQGEDISFELPAGGDHHRFRGRVSGDTMEGTVQLANGKGVARWSATRLKG